MPILYHPVKRVFFTQLFGLNPRFYPGLKGHPGLDYRTRWPETPKGHVYIYALQPGIVCETGDQDIIVRGRKLGKGYGRFIRINHDDGSQSVYGHNETAYVKTGQRVTLDTILALSGNTGQSTGSHSHVGYRPPNWASPKIYNNGFRGYINFKPFLRPRP